MYDPDRQWQNHKEVSKHVTVETFEKEVLEAELPVVVDFWATWCGPCKMFAPVLEDFAKSYEGRVKVVKVDVDAEAALAMEYQIMSVPTVMVFQNGKKTQTSIGVIGKDELAALAGLQ